MNKITALSAVKAVGTATAGTSNKQVPHQQIRNGQIFAATVMEPAGANRFYLNILDHKILAQSDDISLPLGSRINLEVINSAPLLQLKLVSSTSGLFLGKILTLLGKRLNIDGLFQSLTSSDSPLLNQVPSTKQGGLRDFNDPQSIHLGNKNGGAYLKKLLDRLNLSLDALLAGGQKNTATQSLNTALLNIATLMKHGSELTESTSILLSTLQLSQHSQLQLAADNLHIFPLPAPFSENGYLLLEKDKNEQKAMEDGGSNHFSVHLSIEPLGNIELTFYQTKDGLYLNISCESNDKCNFFHESQDTLKRILQTTELLGIRFNTKAGNPTSDLIRKLVPAGETMLDTKI